MLAYHIGLLFEVIELDCHVGLSRGVIVMGYFRDYCVWLSCEIILLGYRLGLSFGAIFGLIFWSYCFSFFGGELWCRVIF